MKPDPRSLLPSICTTAGLTAAATAATGSDEFGSTVAVDPLANAGARPVAELPSSVTRANTKPATRRTSAPIATAPIRRPPPRVGAAGAASVGGGGIGGGGGGTTATGEVTGGHGCCSSTGGSGAGHDGGRMPSQSTSLTSSEPIGGSVKRDESGQLGGSQSTKVEPRPGLEARATVPPWRSAISCTIVSPSPLRRSPSVSFWPGARQKRSKTCSWCSAGMPGPSSATDTYAQLSLTPASTVIVEPSGARRTALPMRLASACFNAV